ncbi:hypothetical protein PV04_09968 [Phialophora macrospora]|uniref:Fe2OG dioxygenase domain-containing protein n=1 Tax=Phialophora macrospora TaxID=1851006 RepID=A0A0D2CDE8_9EURO|nr:hypothetical protein PV04_09968 [Phialophora macrospora]
MMVTELSQPSSAPQQITLQNGMTITTLTNVSKETDQIPIIDFAGIYSPKLEDRQAVATQVREAASKIGFFYAINHGVDTSSFQKCIEHGKKFFDLPTEEKCKLHTDLIPDEFVGYHPLNSYRRNGCKLRDLSEAFNWGYEAGYDPVYGAENRDLRCANVWPEQFPEMKEDLMHYWQQLLSWSRKLSQIVALALHMPEDYFDKFVKRPEAAMRIMHYPQQEASLDDQNGIGAHTDFTAFTTVTQDGIGGLEVLSKSGEWIKATPIPGSFVINIGDCLMRQTNDFLVSTVHRVINKTGAERFSVPFFFGFNRDMDLTPVPSCVSEDNPAKYPLMTAGEYVKFRANTTKQTKSS